MALCVGSVRVCTGHFRSGRVGASGTTLSTGVCVGCLAPVSLEATRLLSSGHRACRMCPEDYSLALSTPLSAPIATCPSGWRSLHRPYKFGLDGQPRCVACLSALLSGGVLFEDMVARATVVAQCLLQALYERCPDLFMAAAEAFPRPLGRLLAGACVSFWSACELSAAAALRPISLRSRAGWATVNLALRAMCRRRSVGRPLAGGVHA